MNMKLQLSSSRFPPDSFDQGPGIVTIDITDELRERIFFLASVVRLARCYTVTEFNYAPVWTYWEEGEDGNERPGLAYRTDCDKLHVSETEFWWSCVHKHADLRVTTERSYVSWLSKDADARILQLTEGRQK